MTLSPDLIVRVILPGHAQRLPRREPLNQHPTSLPTLFLPGLASHLRRFHLSL
jgi:hypothetical protein